MTHSGTSLSALGLRPSKIIGLLGNDAGGGKRVSEDVDFFLKAPSSLIGGGGAVQMPSGVDVRVVPECELAVVIGAGGAAIAVADAIEHVAGYTIALDLTVRGPHDRSRRKSHDTFCPVGPRVVPAVELGDARGRSVQLRIDGEVVQDWSTDRMVLGVPQAVSWISSIMTLEEGDLVLMGAPKMTRQLEAGQTLLAEIDGIGALEIPVAG